MSGVEESIIRQRVVGLSGLGLAEEQRMRRATAAILSPGSTVSPEYEQAIEQLELQAIRLGIIHRRHTKDYQLITADTSKLHSHTQEVEADTLRLEDEAERWRTRNSLFTDLEHLGDEIVAAGPPIQELRVSLSKVERDIAKVEAQCRTERQALLEKAQQLRSLLDSIKQQPLL